MDGAVRQLIEQSNHDAFSGLASFGSEIGGLMRVGVESYLVDYRVANTTYYTHDDQTITLPMATPAVTIPHMFNKHGLIAAIRRAQSGAMKYPEFVAQSMAAGCVGYVVWITGQHVGYLDRKGVAYVDPFLGSS